MLTFRRLVNGFESITGITSQLTLSKLQEVGGVLLAGYDDDTKNKVMEGLSSLQRNSPGTMTITFMLSKGRADLGFQISLDAGPLTDTEEVALNFMIRTLEQAITCANTSPRGRWNGKSGEN